MLWQVYKRISSLELSILGRISNNKGYGILHYIFDENISILNILNEYISYILLIPTPYF